MKKVDFYGIEDTDVIENQIENEIDFYENYFRKLEGK